MDSVSPPPQSLDNTEAASNPPASNESYEEILLDEDSENPTGPSTTIDCRYISVGDYKCLPAQMPSGRKISAFFCKTGIFFEIPHSQNQNQLVKCVIPTDRILQIHAHFRPRLPVMFIVTGPKYSTWIRNRLGLGNVPLSNTLYYCSLNGGVTQRHITLMVENFSDGDISTIAKIFRKGLTEIDFARANALLTKQTTRAEASAGNEADSMNLSQVQTATIVGSLVADPIRDSPGPSTSSSIINMNGEEEMGNVAVSTIIGALQQQIRHKILNGVAVDDLLNRYVSLHQSNTELRLEKRILELQKEALENQRQNSSALSFAEFRYKEEAFRQVQNILEQEFSCSICNEVYIEPAVVDCGHTFCNSCINQARRANHDCPICRQFNSSTSVKHVEMRNFITKLYALLPDDVRNGREQVVRERNAVVPPLAADESVDQQVNNDLFEDYIFGRPARLPIPPRRAVSLVTQVAQTPIQTLREPRERNVGSFNTLINRIITRDVEARDRAATENSNSSPIMQLLPSSGSGEPSTSGQADRPNVERRLPSAPSVPSYNTEIYDRLEQYYAERSDRERANERQSLLNEVRIGSSTRAPRTSERILRNPSELSSAMEEWRRMHGIGENDQQQQVTSSADRLSRAIDLMRDSGRRRTGTTSPVNAAIHRYWGRRDLPHFERSTTRGSDTSTGRLSLVDQRPRASPRVAAAAAVVEPQRDTNTDRQSGGSGSTSGLWRVYRGDSSDSDSDLVIWPAGEDPTI